MFVITSEIDTKLSFGEFTLTVPQNSIVSIQENNIHIKEKEEVVPCVPIAKEVSKGSKVEEVKLKGKEQWTYKENDEEECEYREFSSDIKTSGLSVQDILGGAHHQSCQYTNRHKKYNTVRLDAETFEKERNMADAGEVVLVFPLQANPISINSKDIGIDKREDEEPNLNVVD